MSTMKDDFVSYLEQISKKMISETSSYSTQIKKIEDQLIRFGLTNEQFAVAITEVNKAATQFITQYANSSAIELIRLETQQPLLDAQIELANKDLEIKDKEIAIKEKDLELKDKELELKDKEIEIATKELELKQADVALKEQQILESQAKVQLIQAQTQTEVTQRGLIQAQTALIDRQVQGYDDNLLVKAAEFEGSLASFAVNAGSTSAQSAINNFNSTISQIKARA